MSGESFLSVLGWPASVGILLQYEHFEPRRDEGFSFPSVGASMFLSTVRRSKGGLATFRKRDGHSRKDGFPDFRCVHVGRES